MMAWLGLALLLGHVYTASAQAPTCAPDMKLDSTNTTCICDPAQYNASEPLADPVLQCLPGQMTLTLKSCELQVKKYNVSSVHLLDPSCVGQNTTAANGTSEIVLSFNATSQTCGNILWANDTFATYSNNLTISGAVLSGGIIERNNISMNFSCSYPLNMTASLVTALHPIISSVSITLPGGLGTVLATMAAFTQPDFTGPVTDTTVLNVQDPLYVSVSIPALDGEIFSTLVVSLWAQGTNDSSSNPTQYFLLNNNCPTSDLGSLISPTQNGATSEARFIVSLFKISSSAELYLFAKLQICNSTCTPTCSGSRIEARDDSTASLGIGPFTPDDSGTGSGAADRFSWSWTVNSLLLSLLGLRLL